MWTSNASSSCGDISLESSQWKYSEPTRQLWVFAFFRLILFEISIKSDPISPTNYPNTMKVVGELPNALPAKPAIPDVVMKSFCHSTRFLREPKRESSSLHSSLRMVVSWLSSLLILPQFLNPPFTKTCRCLVSGVLWLAMLQKWKGNLPFS